MKDGGAQMEMSQKMSQKSFAQRLKKQKHANLRTKCKMKKIK